MEGYNTMTLGTLITKFDDTIIQAENGYCKIAFDRRTGTLELASGLRVRCQPAVAGASVEREETVIAVNDPTLLRLVERGRLGSSLTYRTSYDLYQTRNLHIYVRLEASDQVEVDALELPQINFLENDLTIGEHDEAPIKGRAIDLPGKDHALGIVVKKLPWVARWNDIGCFGHRVLSDAAIVVDPTRAASPSWCRNP